MFFLLFTHTRTLFVSLPTRPDSTATMLYVHQQSTWRTTASAFGPPLPTYPLAYDTLASSRDIPRSLDIPFIHNLLAMDFALDSPYKSTASLIVLLHSAIVVLNPSNLSIMSLALLRI